MSIPAASDAIVRSIRQFVAENLLYTPEGYGYPDDASFLQEGIVDSLGVMQLVTYVQTEFGIMVAPAEVTPEHFDSVTRLAAFVQRKRGG